jgi:hypothetical protein
LVSGYRRVPAPPPRMMPSTFCAAAVPGGEQRQRRGATRSAARPGARGAGFGCVSQTRQPDPGSQKQKRVCLAPPARRATRRARLRVDGLLLAGSRRRGSARRAARVRAASCRRCRHGISAHRAAGRKLCAAKTRGEGGGSGASVAGVRRRHRRVGARCAGAAKRCAAPCPPSGLVCTGEQGTRPRRARCRAAARGHARAGRTVPATACIAAVCIAAAARGVWPSANACPRPACSSNPAASRRVPSTKPTDNSALSLAHARRGGQTHARTHAGVRAERAAAAAGHDARSPPAGARAPVTVMLRAGAPLALRPPPPRGRTRRRAAAPQRSLVVVTRAGVRTLTRFLLEKCAHTHTLRRFFASLPPPACRHATSAADLRRVCTHTRRACSRELAGNHVALSSLPRSADGRVSLVADGSSLAFWLLGERCTGDDDPQVAAWHMGGEYRELATRTRHVARVLRLRRVLHAWRAKRACHGATRSVAVRRLRALHTHARCVCCARGVRVTGSRAPDTRNALPACAGASRRGCGRRACT